MSRAKQIRYRFEWLGLLALTKAVPLMSRRTCVRVAEMIGRIAFRFDERGRKVALANIEAAFPGKYAPQERAEIARKSYENFARTMLDLFWAPRLSAENYGQYMQVDASLFGRLQQEGKSAVLMCVHQGNFEWASLAIGFAGFPTQIVAETFKNPLLSDIFNGVRQVSGHTIIAQDASMIRLLKHVKRKGLAGMLIDLNLPPTQAAVVIKTFGMETCVTFLHALLALRGGAAMVPVDGQPQPDGSCKVVVHPPLEISAEATPQEVAQACWDLYEPLIRARPELWMWAYKHWRYKPKDAEREYPFYANSSGKFEKLRKEMANHLTKRP